MSDKKINVDSLRRDRSEVNDKLQAIATMEAEGTEITAEQEDEFMELTTQFDNLTKKIERAEAAEAMGAASAAPVVPVASKKVRSQLKGPDVPGAKLAQMVQSLAAASGNASEAAVIADSHQMPEVAAALSTGSQAGGAVLIPTDLASEVIELLRPLAIVRSMGAIPIPMPNGNATIPKLAGGSTATYIGSDDDMPTTEPSFGDLQLSAKKLAALVPISNDLISFNSFGVEKLVVNDLVSSLGEREDKAFIRDDGTAGTPKGLRHWAPAGNLVVANVTTDLQTIEFDLGSLQLRLMNANVKMRNCGWIMAPRTFMYLEGLKDGNGNKVYPEMAKGMLKGYPVRFTTQIPVNLGGGGDESEIYFQDFNNAIIGESQNMRISISSEATYKDGANLVSAFSKDQTLVRVIEEHDFGMRHDESVAVLTGVKWGS